MDPWAQTSRDREWGRTNEDGGPDLKHQQYIAAPCWTRTKLHCHLPSWMILVIFGEDVWRCSKMWQLRFAVCTHIFSECLRTWLWEARETRMGSHMGNALTMSYGFEMNFSRSAFFFDGTFSRFMFSFHLIGGLCVFVGLHRLCSRGSLRDRDLRDLRASTVQQKRRFSVPRFAGRSSRRQLDPHGGWPPCLLGLWSWWEPRSCLCFACFLLFLFVSAMICYILRCAWIFSLAHTCPTLKLAFSCCLHFLECFCGLERLGVACFYNLPELGQYSHS